MIAGGGLLNFGKLKRMNKCAVLVEPLTRVQSGGLSHFGYFFQIGSVQIVCSLLSDRCELHSDVVSLRCCIFKKQLHFKAAKTCKTLLAVVPDWSHTIGANVVALVWFNFFFEKCTLCSN